MAKNFRKTMIVGISLISAGFLIFGIAAYFLSGAIAAEADKISNEKNAIRNRSELIQGLAEQKISSPEVERFQQAINLLLPPKDDLVNFLGWLDGLSRAHQVGVNFYFAGEAVAPANSQPGYIKYVMNASGAYANLSDFLRDVELKAPRYTVSFDDFDLKRDLDKYNFNANGRIFFR